MRAVAVLMVLTALLVGGCGGSGPTRNEIVQNCEQTEWQGRQCDAVKQIRHLESKGFPPYMAKDAASLPESFWVNRKGGKG